MRAIRVDNEFQRAIQRLRATTVDHPLAIWSRLLILKLTLFAQYFIANQEIKKIGKTLWLRQTTCKRTSPVSATKYTYD